MDPIAANGWNAWARDIARGIVREEIERHSSIMDAAVGQALGESIARLRKEFETKIDALRAELGKAHSSEVVEMPKIARRRDAA